MTIKERIKEIEALEWGQIKAIADKLGYSKPDGQSWVESAEAIAQLESQQSSESVEEKKVVKPVKAATEEKKIVEPVEENKPAKPNYKKGGVLYCGVCDRPLKTSPTGEPTCH